MGFGYAMAKAVLYQYLLELKSRGVDVSVELSGINRDGTSDGWLVNVHGEAPRIEAVIEESRVRPDSHLIRGGGKGHILTVDRSSTASVVAALFDHVATTGEWIET